MAFEARIGINPISWTNDDLPSLGGETPLDRRPQFRTDAEWNGYAERLMQFSRHIASRGVAMAYHHHMGAYVEHPRDVDRLMSLTGPEVGLLFDTGHMTFAGGNAPAEL